MFYWLASRKISLSGAALSPFTRPDCRAEKTVVLSVEKCTVHLLQICLHARRATRIAWVSSTLMWAGGSVAAFAPCEKRGSVAAFAL